MEHFVIFFSPYSREKIGEFFDISRGETDQPVREFRRKQMSSDPIRGQTKQITLLR